jgi:acyl-CoA synthetase (AMP-forming)/AMP-acid ligase II
VPVTVVRPWEGYESLAEVVTARAAKAPDETAIVLYRDDDSELPITAGQLHHEASRYAGVFRNVGVKEGDVVIISLDHSSDVFSSFWGALYLGAIPSIFPAQYPIFDPSVYARHIGSVINSSGIRLVVTTSEMEPILGTELRDLDCSILSPDSIAAEVDEKSLGIQPTFSTGESPAYIQFTSGATGLQKGVLLSHRAVLNFVTAMTEQRAVGPGDVVVNWMPLYHDFGLFAGLIMPMSAGIRTVLISTFKWVRSPRVMIEAVDRYRGSFCYIPNFAYRHLMKSVPAADVGRYDLSSLRTLGCGGEMVSYNDQQAFLEHFSSSGLKAEALAVGYGMAEDTVVVALTRVGERARVDWVDAKSLQEGGTADPVDREAAGARPVLSCGPPVPGAEISVVDEHGGLLEDRIVGEIIIRTNALFSGYYGRDDLTEEVMNDGWYSTGDLGYIAEDDVFVCGRKKDLIIFRGGNYYPEDFEAVANEIPGIAPGRVVAFGIKDDRIGSEKIVIVCDLKKDVDREEKYEIERELRSRIFKELNVALSELHLTQKGWVVKTHNGKLARGANREKYERELAKKRETGDVAEVVGLPRSG